LRQQKEEEAREGGGTWYTAVKQMAARAMARPSRLVVTDVSVRVAMVTPMQRMQTAPTFIRFRFSDTQLDLQNHSGS
jgi:hypothetical protein